MYRDRDESIKWGSDSRSRGNWRRGPAQSAHARTDVIHEATVARSASDAARS